MTNPTPQPQRTKRIKLSNANRFVTVDALGWPLVAGTSWRLKRDKGELCYARGSLGGRDILMHNLIRPDAPMIDHRDRNGLNNRRSNLRTCNNSDNQGNRRKNKSGTSRYKGVCWHRITKQWFAQIQRHRVKYSLGYSRTEKEAARKYNAAARRLFGRFARLNPV